MNYLNITHCDQVNGDGNRVVLWTAGCSHHCKNCQNEYSWDEKAGILFGEKDKQEIFKDLETDWCAGITFSGGDPLFCSNRKEIIELSKEIREKFPNKTQWLYTGFYWNEIIDDESMKDILKYVDVVCDGPFVESLKDAELKWVGSSNQHVIDVKERIRKIQEIGNTLN